MNTTPAIFLKLLSGFLPGSRTPAANALAATFANELRDEPGLVRRVLDLDGLGVVCRAAALRRVANEFGASETADALRRMTNPTLYKQVVRHLQQTEERIACFPLPSLKAA